jgi:membrane protein
MRLEALVRRLPWAITASAVATGLVLGAASPRRENPPQPPGGRPQGRDGRRPANDDHAFGEARSTDEPRWKQHARSAQPGRGRDAVSPWQIPWKGWKDIFWRVYEEIGKDRLISVAAGVVFFGLLATFPAITALVSSYGLFADASTIGDHLSTLAAFVPPTAFEIVRDQIARITSKGGGQLSFAFLFGLGLALWSANAGMKAIFDALNVVYDEDEKRSFIKLNLVSLTFTLGAIVALLFAVAAVIVFPLILTFFGISKVNPLLLSILRWPVLFAVIIFGLALLYRYGPSRKEPEWRWISVGSVFAAVTWVLGSLAFSYYLAKFADYDATYGSLGAVIGLMMWMWLSSIVILVGAEINAEMEHQTARDSTDDRYEKPLGARGAAMADTVGEAKA